MKSTTTENFRKVMIFLQLTYAILIMPMLILYIYFVFKVDKNLNFTDTIIAASLSITEAIPFMTMGLIKYICIGMIVFAVFLIIMNEIYLKMKKIDEPMSIITGTTILVVFLILMCYIVESVLPQIIMNKKIEMALDTAKYISCENNIELYNKDRKVDLGDCDSIKKNFKMMTDVEYKFDGSGSVYLEIKPFYLLGSKIADSRRANLLDYVDNKYIFTFTD